MQLEYEPGSWRLTVKSRFALTDALVSAYPSKSDLESVLRLRCDITYNLVVSSLGNYRMEVLSLVQWAENHDGKLQGLVDLLEKKEDMVMVNRSEREYYDLLLERFPDWASLEAAMQMALGERLNCAVGPGNMTHVVFQLVYNWAKPRGYLSKLERLLEHTPNAPAAKSSTRREVSRRGILRSDHEFAQVVGALASVPLESLERTLESRHVNASVIQPGAERYPEDMGMLVNWAERTGQTRWLLEQLFFATQSPELQSAGQLVAGRSHPVG